MIRNNTERFSSYGITVCIGKELFADAVLLAKEIHQKGVSCFLIDWEHGDGRPVLQALAAACPGALCGAAGVHDCQEAKDALAAGSALLAARRPERDLIQYAKEHDVPLIADCANEDELRSAAGDKAELLRPLDGATWDALRCEPDYQDLKWVIPCHGAESSRLFLEPRVLSVCVKLSAAQTPAGREQLEALLREMLGFSFDHLGINCADSQEAQTTAHIFETVFGFPSKDMGKSIFCGPCIEALKAPFTGLHGHICIGTANVSRAMRYLSQMGFTFLEGSEKYVDGTLIVVYLNEEISGFGFHLLLK